MARTRPRARAYFLTRPRVNPLRRLAQGVGGQAERAACEHVFVTSQGSAYSQFRRALERRNALVAWATAAELPHVELGDALALVLLALDHDAPRFDRAAVRWHSRLCREVPLTLAEAQLALSALRALGSPSRVGAVDALLGVAERHGLATVVTVLGRAR
jgi:hypothetical protein